MDSMETALKSLEQYHADETAGLLIRLGYLAFSIVSREGASVASTPSV